MSHRFVKLADFIRRCLNQVVSDAHQYLMEERARSLHLMVENDGLRVQEMQDRARIQRLLSSEGHLAHLCDPNRVGSLSNTNDKTIMGDVFHG